MPYQTVGNLKITFPGHDNYSDYYRELDIEKAVVSSHYILNGVKYETKVFSSYPDQVIITQIKADKPGSITFNASMDRPSKVNVTTKGNNELILTGLTSDEKVKGGVQFEAKVKILTQGGSISTGDATLNVVNADVVTIYISIASNFKNYNDISANADEKVNAYLQKALKKKYGQAIKDHIADYQSYFKRVNLDLGVSNLLKGTIHNL